MIISSYLGYNRINWAKDLKERDSQDAQEILCIQGSPLTPYAMYL